MESMPVTLLASFTDATRIGFQVLKLEHEPECDHTDTKIIAEIAMGGDDQPQIVIGTDLLGIERLLATVVQIRQHILDEVFDEQNM